MAPRWHKVTAHCLVFSPSQSWADSAGSSSVCSTLIGRGMSRLGSHWLDQLSYAIKNQLKAPKAPYLGLWDEIPLRGGLHAQKGSIRGRWRSNSSEVSSEWEWTSLMIILVDVVYKYHSVFCHRICEPKHSAAVNYFYWASVLSDDQRAGVMRAGREAKTRMWTIAWPPAWLADNNNPSTSSSSSSSNTPKHFSGETRAESLHC